MRVTIYIYHLLLCCSVPFVARYESSSTIKPFSVEGESDEKSEKTQTKFVFINTDSYIQRNLGIAFTNVGVTIVFIQVQSLAGGTARARPAR